VDRVGKEAVSIPIEVGAMAGRIALLSLLALAHLRYAGAQAPAGDTAVVFAPGVVSTAHEFTVTFSPDAHELLFTRFNSETRTQHIMRAVLGAAGWSLPEAVPFGSSEWSDLDPSLSPDGNRMYFVSTRPRPGGRAGPPRNMDIWYADRAGAGWGEPQWIAAASSDGKEGSPTVDRSGTLCFFSDRGNKPNENVIYCAPRTGTAWGEPVRLGGGVNDGPSNTSPWLTPDGNTLLFYSSREGGHGKGDLYLSSKRDGGWTAPINLGPLVNTPESEYNPSFSPDGKTLYFGRGGNIWMIPAGRLGDHDAPSTGKRTP
jgi:Tol biopolymer transport system component